MTSLVTTDQFIYQVEHSKDDETKAVYVVEAVLITLATIAVILRFLSRRIKAAPYLLDDWLIVVALAFAYGLFVIGILSAHYGMGKHAVKVGIPNVIKFLKLQFIFEIVYCFCVAITKFSILLLYRRIFRLDSFKKWLVGVAIFVFLWAVSTIFAAIFQCMPIRLAWQKDLGHGKCVDLAALVVSTGVLNMLTDIIILIIPMPIVWSLKISNRQKVAVSAIFLLGGFVCVASMVRISYLPRVVNGGDPTYTNLPAGIWSTVEPCIGIVCACLPIMRPLFIKLIPDKLISTMNSSQRRPSAPSWERKQSLSSSAGKSWVSWPGMKKWKAAKNSGTDSSWTNSSSGRSWGASKPSVSSQGGLHPGPVGARNGDIELGTTASAAGNEPWRSFNPHEDSRFVTSTILHGSPSPSPTPEHQAQREREREHDLEKGIAPDDAPPMPSLTPRDRGHVHARIASDQSNSRLLPRPDPHHPPPVPAKEPFPPSPSNASDPPHHHRPSTSSQPHHHPFGGIQVHTSTTWEREPAPPPERGRQGRRPSWADPAAFPDPLDPGVSGMFSRPTLSPSGGVYVRRASDASVPLGRRGSLGGATEARRGSEGVVRPLRLGMGMERRPTVTGKRRVGRAGSAGG